MVKLVTCPGCTTQLMLPEGATLSDDARCPRCAARFPLMESVHVTLPMAELLPPLEVENSEGYDLEPDFDLPQSSPKKPASPETTPTPADLDSLTLESFAERIGKSSITNMKGESGQEEHSMDDAEALQMQAQPESSSSVSHEEEAVSERPLSSWEQRLKRALADDTPVFSTGSSPAAAAAETPEEGPEEKPEQFAISIPEFPSCESLPIEKSPQPDADSTSPDFEVSASDLFPEKPAPAPNQADASYAKFEALENLPEPEEGDATVRFDADQTLSDYQREDKANDTEFAPGPVAETLEVRQQAPRTGERPGKRKRSLARLAFSLALGTVGIPLGLYALLWLRGPQADVAHLGSVLPEFLLPASMRVEREAGRIGVQQPSPLVADDKSKPRPGRAATSEFIEDPEVQEATATSAIGTRQALEENYQGPVFPSISSDRFRELFGDCIDASSRLEAEGFNERTEKAAKVKAFMNLCQLAEISSYLNQPGLSASESRLANAAREMFSELLAKAIVQRDLPQIVGPWWNYETRSSQGILLVGQVISSETTPAGQLLKVSFSDQNQSYEIPMLVGRDAPALGQRAGFVGTILEEPAGQLPALESAPPQIAVVHYSFSLPQLP